MKEKIITFEFDKRKEDIISEEIFLCQEYQYPEVVSMVTIIGEAQKE